MFENSAQTKIYSLISRRAGLYRIQVTSQSTLYTLDTHLYTDSYFLTNPAQSSLSRLELRVSKEQVSLVGPHEPVPEDVHGVGDAHPPHLSLSCPWPCQMSKTMESCLSPVVVVLGKQILLNIIILQYNKLGLSCAKPNNIFTVLIAEVR